jgi:hypothetical protein
MLNLNWSIRRKPNDVNHVRIGAREMMVEGQYDCAESEKHDIANK